MVTQSGWFLFTLMSVNVLRYVENTDTTDTTLNTIISEADSTLLANFVEESFPTIDRRESKDDRFLNTSQLLRKYGYPVEEYFVITEDGYNLTMIRTPRSGPPVLLMHGLFSSSDDYLTSGSDRAMAYLLADAGYDVWLGNARGSLYSRRHVTLSPEERAYWLFSWHEIGYYDLPAMIDLILQITNRSQLTYIGHSQGTTIFYVLCSLRPEYNKKIFLNFSLAPVAWVWHLKPAIVRAAVPLKKLEHFISFNVGLNEIFPRTPFSIIITAVLCSQNKLTLLMCITFLFIIFGFNYAGIHFEALPEQLSHIPSGSSLRQLTHYAQQIETKRFEQYDHGTQKNLKLYGTKLPPSYPVQNVTAPTIIFYGLNDLISVYEDIQILLDSLPNVLGAYRIPQPKFNHFDFVWSRDGKQLLYWKILYILNEKTRESV